MDKKTETEAKLTFIAFCIEEYKTLHSMDGATAAAWLEKCGVTDYLMEHFDVLHTLDRAVILADIERFIEVRRRKK